MYKHDIFVDAVKGNLIWISLRVVSYNLQPNREDMQTPTLIIPCVNLGWNTYIPYPKHSF